MTFGLSRAAGREIEVFVEADVVHHRVALAPSHNRQTAIDSGRLIERLTLICGSSRGYGRWLDFYDARLFAFFERKERRGYGIWHVLKGSSCRCIDHHSDGASHDDVARKARRSGTCQLRLHRDFHRVEALLGEQDRELVLATELKCARRNTDMAHRCSRLSLRRIGMNLDLIGGTASHTGAASDKKPHRNQHKLMHTPHAPFCLPQQMIPQRSIVRKMQTL